jgi:hypothetical protein
VELPIRRPPVVAVLALCLLAAPLAAQRRDTSPLADLLQIVVQRRQLLAIDAESGGQLEEPLQLGEQVLWHATQGRVGVALTDRRVLAVGVGSGAWQETRYRNAERRPQAASLGDRVALVLTSQRVLGFDGGSRNLIEHELGPQESVRHSRVGQNVAVVVTSRLALGLSPFVGGFFTARLDVGERIEALAAFADHATLTTSRRLLIFRSTTGSWEERSVDIGE